MWYITNLLCAVSCVLCCKSQQEELYKMWFALLICADDHVSRTRTKCDLLIVLPNQTGGPGGPGGPTWTKPAQTKTKTWATIFSSGEKIGRRQERCGSRIRWNGRGASSLKTRSDRMVVAFSVGERIREGKILFVVAADSLPEKVLCRGHYFQLSTKSFWS